LEDDKDFVIENVNVNEWEMDDEVNDEENDV
jgi:hypothetical protein